MKLSWVCAGQVQCLQASELRWLISARIHLSMHETKIPILVCKHLHPPKALSHINSHTHVS